MNFYLRKNGTVIGPISQADFLARLGSGEFAATDEMSTDGRIWTRIGLTGFARNIRQTNLAAPRKINSVVQDLTKPGAAPGAAPLATGADPKAVSSAPVGGDNMVSPPRRSSILPTLIGVLLLLVAAVAAFCLFKGPCRKNSRPAAAQADGKKPAPAATAQDADETGNGDEGDSADGQRALLIDPISDEDKASVVADVSPLSRGALAAYLFPAPDVVLGWFNVIRKSDYILKNAEYRLKADNVWFRYNESTNEVNAYASARDEASDNVHANLNVFGGMVRFSRVIGAVMASSALAGDDAQPRLALLTEKIGPAEDFSPEGCVALLDECGIAPEWFLNEAFVQEAENLANGVGMAVIAHEMGHVACGHIWRIADISAETSRNKEREADLFSFSVSSEEKTYALGAISRYMFLGNVYMLLAWSAQDAALVQAVVEREGTVTPEQLDAIRARIMGVRTHPYAGARLLDLLRSKEDMARQFGLDPVAIETSLRSLGIH